MTARVSWLLAIVRALLVVLTLAIAPLAFGRAALVYADVNTFTGSYEYQFTDITLPASGPALRFVRAYNSVDTRVGPLGPGWTHSYDVRLRSPGDGSGDLLLIGPNGRSDRYTASADRQQYTPPPAISTTLVRNADGSYTATHPDQTTWTIMAGTGRLMAIRDRHGRGSRLAYNESGQLVGISDPAGRGELTLSYDPVTGRLVRVADWMDPPRIVRYGYDAHRRLTSVTDREGHTTQFTYEDTTPDRRHLLTSIIDARGHVAMTITYDDQRRVATQRNAHGHLTGDPRHQTTFAYTGDAGKGRVTSMTYPPGNFAPQWNPVRTDTYDAQNRIIERVDQPAPGERVVTRFTYDEAWRQTAIGPDGRPLAGYRRGEIPVSSCPPTFISHRSPPLPRNWPVAGDAASPWVAAFMSAMSDLLAQAVPDTLTAETAGEGQQRATLSDTFDAGPLPLSPHSRSDIFTYDAVGRVTRLTVSAPVAPGETLMEHSWRFTYDNEDRVLSVQLSSAASAPRVATYKYDAVGNLTHAIEPTGQSTRYVYNERDGLAEVWIGLPGEGEQVERLVASYEYDPRGNLSRVWWHDEVTGQDHAVDYAYDGLHRLRRTTEYPLWPDTSNPRVVTHEYDLSGACTVTVHP